jgi:hypothetical protein
MLHNIDTLWDRIKIALTTAIPYRDPREDIPERYETAYIKHITEQLLKQRSLEQCLHVQYQQNEVTGQRLATIYLNFPKSLSVTLPYSITQFPSCLPQGEKRAK